MLKCLMSCVDNNGMSLYTIQIVGNFHGFHWLTCNSKNKHHENFNQVTLTAYHNIVYECVRIGVWSELRVHPMKKNKLSSGGSGGISVKISHYTVLHPLYLSEAHIVTAQYTTVHTMHIFKPLMYVIKSFLHTNTFVHNALPNGPLLRKVLVCK